MPITIGDIELANNVAAAPMSGVSDLPFRRAAARLGAGLVVSEMVASAELAKARPDVVKRAEGDASVFPFVVQLAGREPKWMAEGARLADAAGADIIDINMGCPSRQVTGALSGSALMRDLDLALAIIEATVASTSKPVTLKMRLGWDRDMMNAPELGARAIDAGVKMLTVHGRTRNQFYKGEADWRAVKPVVEVATVPVLVNGDIVDLAAAREALRQSGADGVMIGRAAIGRPWLPGAVADALDDGGEAAPPPLAEQAAIAIRHYRDTIDHYGAPLGVRMARKHLAAYIDHAPVPLSPELRRAARAQICTLSCPDTVEEALARFYDRAEEACPSAA
ncbi:MAG: tRNA dihydrouridine synthase DusB [Pseudomonadota bacterium]